MCAAKRQKQQHRQTAPTTSTDARRKHGPIVLPFLLNTGWFLPRQTIYLFHKMLVLILSMLRVTLYNAYTYTQRGATPLPPASSPWPLQCSCVCAGSFYRYYCWCLKPQKGPNMGNKPHHNKHICILILSLCLLLTGSLLNCIHYNFNYNIVHLLWCISLSVGKRTK